MSQFLLHPSSLPTWNDCEGRWAATNLPSLKKQVTGGQNFVGSVFGTAAHEAVAKMLEHKIETGEIPEVAPFVREAQSRFREKFLKGVKTDETTKTVEQGEKQLERVIRESWFSYIPYAAPLAVETELILPIQQFDFLVMVMKPDCINSWRGLTRIDDHKFPRQLGNYGAQGGGYILGVEAEMGQRVRGFELQVIQRVALSSAPAKLEPIFYSRDQCLDAALPAITRLGEVLSVWRKEKNRKIFRFNGSSKFCTKTTCPLWGGEFCNQWIDNTKGKRTHE